MNTHTRTYWDLLTFELTVGSMVYYRFSIGTLVSHKPIESVVRRVI